jgi:hypothetical protein
MENVVAGASVLMSRFREAACGNKDIGTPYEVYSAGSLCFQAMNRCLTPVGESDGIDELPVPPETDPTGRLRDVVGGEYVYTSDNEVAYTKAIGQGEDIR